MRAFVYFNLHRRLFSVRDTHTGRVVEHTRWLMMRDCSFSVGRAGRQRVLAEQRKNVHAGVRGVVLEDPLGDEHIHRWLRITYDPYRFETFVTLPRLRKVRASTRAILEVRDDRAYVYASWD